MEISFEFTKGVPNSALWVCNFCREDQGQVDFSALEQLENPDLHVGSIQIMNLYSKVKEMVASVDCPIKFTLKDLIRPDAARTEFFFSAILNFCLHKYVLQKIIA